MIWFTLGNISVEGTYTTHALNLTPRGLLLVTAAAALLSCAAAAAASTVRISRRDAYSCGYPFPYIFSQLYLINAYSCQLPLSILAASSQLFKLAASYQLAASRSFSQLYSFLAAGQLAQLSASRARIFPANSQLIVIIS